MSHSGKDFSDIENIFLTNFKRGR